VLKGEVDQLRELVSEEKSYIEELKAQSDVDRQRCSELEEHITQIDFNLTEKSALLKEAQGQANVYRDKCEA